MRSSPLILLSMFFLIAAHAESPNLEDSPGPAESSSFAESSILIEPFDISESETSALDAELVLFDEEIDDWEEEFAMLDSAIAEAEKKSPATVLKTNEPKIQSPVIDIAMPLDNIEENLSLDIIEDKAIFREIIASAEEKSAASPSASSALGDNTVVLLQSAEEQPSLEAEAPAVLTIESSSSDIKSNLDIQLDLKRAFAGSPLIYSLLFAMSVFSVFIWIYNLLILKKSAQVTQQVLGTLHTNLNGNQFDQALDLCRKEETLLCKMVASGIQSRKYGQAAMIESMKAEGKRSSMRFWQKISLLNDIAILAPMLGLLGTVLGMFYAFYDVNRSIESITSLFDGLGVSVGTTVAGLIVAILALILHSTAKYRLIKVLSTVESEAHGIASLIDNHTSVYGQSK